MRTISVMLPAAHVLHRRYLAARLQLAGGYLALAIGSQNEYLRQLAGQLAHGEGTADDDIALLNLINAQLPPEIPGKDGSAKSRFKSLEVQETELSRRLAGMGAGELTARNWTELKALQDAIPRETCFVTMARIKVLDHFRYIALVVAPDRADVRPVDLGAVTETEQRIANALRRIKDYQAISTAGEQEAAKAVNGALQELGDAIWKPLRKEVGQYTNLILSPDGALWLVPWAALPDDGDSDRAVIERHLLKFVISGRELVERPSNNKEPTAPIIFGAPNFDQTTSQKAAAVRSVLKVTPATSASHAAGAGLLPKVQPLPGTVRECEAVSQALRKSGRGDTPILYSGDYALESVAKKVVRPRTLVFATHGFFLDGQLPNNPLLRCGLLLSGCNARERPLEGDDGVLTGLEICGMELRGTELVVLSACDSGIGKVNNGDGVAGLRQAFHLAGAKGVVSTLWSIPDQETSLLMTDFFEDLADGKATAMALRNAQLKRIVTRKERHGAAHPYFWGSWTYLGL